MHALIIEDEPIIALLIEEHLRSLGFVSFDFAASEKLAIEAARVRCPDLVTADVRLAQGSGIAAVESICGGRSIPVVFITATGWAVRERLRHAVVIEKPFAPAELNEAVNPPPGAIIYPAKRWSADSQPASPKAQRVARGNLSVAGPGGGLSGPLIFRIPDFGLEHFD